MEKKSITIQEFDKLFEEEKDITEFLDLKTAKRKELETRRVSVDFPKWMIQKLDQQAMKLGVTRQSIIKFWISEKLKSA
ncbi:CopG antitoxin of type II toxin-antitoxin system [Tangfeifania diversioriginum]|uniref:CopG antitoxin of type II toxin-antitoxin system n=1 Tax=Tangfeifania diversioriginum TaxID=1168035 RepID=A0A1M6E1J7_9BACT|nr:CopG family antitoxin [Tangfeifania diversioriginum]SHI79250.1 CopG antitoxin of type II toxin-antitoxin system [Tangfeifania diversioriginum]